MASDYWPIFIPPNRIRLSQVWSHVDNLSESIFVLGKLEAYLNSYLINLWFFKIRSRLYLHLSLDFLSLRPELEIVLKKHTFLTFYIFKFLIKIYIFCINLFTEIGDLIKIAYNYWEDRGLPVFNLEDNCPLLFP